MVVTLVDGKPNFAAAASTFRQVDHGGPAQLVHENLKTFCKRWWDNWRARGNLQDAPRPGRQRIISQADAEMVATLLKQGYFAPVAAKGGSTERLVGYTTIEQAIELNPQVRQIYEQYDCTPHQLWAAAHRADPDLGRKRICSKHMFSQDELQARFEFGRAQLQMLAKEPNYLQLLVFADESTTLLHGHDKQSVQVYCSKSSCTFADVCYFNDPQLKMVKAHYYMAVTANTSFQPGGVVLFDFCTGTDDIHRRVNTLPDGSGRDAAYEYQVSY